MVRIAKLAGFVLLGLLAVPVIGCGGGNGGNGTTLTGASQPGFAIATLPSVTVTPNSTQTISVSVTGTNGFSNAVNFTLSGLPSGVSASPATFALTPAVSSSDVVKNASSSPASQTVTITSEF